MKVSDIEAAKVKGQVLKADGRLVKVTGLRMEVVGLRRYCKKTHRVDCDVLTIKDGAFVRHAFTFTPMQLLGVAYESEEEALKAEAAHEASSKDFEAKEAAALRDRKARMEVARQTLTDLGLKPGMFSFTDFYARNATLSLEDLEALLKMVAAAKAA